MLTNFGSKRGVVDCDKANGRGHRVLGSARDMVETVWSVLVGKREVRGRSRCYFWSGERGINFD